MIAGMSARLAAALGLFLAAVVVLAAALAAPLEFTGLRWDLELDAATPVTTPQPLPSQQALPAVAEPPGEPAAPWLGDALRRIGLVVLLVLAFASAAWLLRRWLRARRTPRRGPAQLGALLAAAEPPAVPAETEPEVETVQRGLDRALRDLDGAREPGDAIVAAWLGLQDTAGESGLLPGTAETATEFTARILVRVRADERAARELLTLYLGVRFGEHPATAPDVARARSALERLAASWQDAPERTRR